MTEQQTVCEGQYYAQKLELPGPDILIWRVESVCDTALHMPHARLVAVRDPMASKMISCRTLTNPAYYERVARCAMERSRPPLQNAA